MKREVCAANIKTLPDVPGYVTGSPNVTNFVRIEFFTAVIMKNGVFWDVTLCGSCKNRRFGGT
jgi:hypothetical protein